jgi:hypothetical protein
MRIKSYKEIEKFCRESNVEELKKSLKIGINHKELDTKEKLIFLLKDFIQTIERHTEK